MDPITGAAIGMSLLSGFMAKKASKKQAQAELNQAYNNAMINEYNADNEKEATARQVDAIRANAVKVRSSQRASIAENGIVVGSGTSQMIEDQTTSLSERDALITMYNSIDKVQAMESEGRNQIAGGHARASAAKDKGNAALISGVSGAVNSYHTYSTMSAKR